MRACDVHWLIFLTQEFDRLRRIHFNGRHGLQQEARLFVQACQQQATGGITVRHLVVGFGN
jgi:hypothetical protein